MRDDQVDMLNAVAADCITSVDRLLRSQDAVFDARLERIESDSVSGLLVNLDRLHEALIREHVQQLKAAMGGAPHLNA